MRELALEHAAGSMGDEAYLARLKALRQQRDAVVERTTAGLPAERALEWLRALGESLQAPEKSKEKADLMHAIYDRITVAGPEIVGVRLRPIGCPGAAGWLMIVPGSASPFGQASGCFRTNSRTSWAKRLSRIAPTCPAPSYIRRVQSGMSRAVSS